MWSLSLSHTPLKTSHGLFYVVWCGAALSSLTVRLTTRKRLLPWLWLVTRIAGWDLGRHSMWCRDWSDFKCGYIYLEFNMYMWFATCYVLGFYMFGARRIGLCIFLMVDFKKNCFERLYYCIFHLKNEL